MEVVVGGAVLLPAITPLKHPASPAADAAGGDGSAPRRRKGDGPAAGAAAALRGTADGTLRTLKQHVAQDGADERTRALLVRAENLAVPLPPVSAEIDRLRRLQAALGDRAESGALTTLADVLSGQQADAADAAGPACLPLPLLPEPGSKPRSEQAVLGRIELPPPRENTIALSSDMRNWLDDVRQMRRGGDYGATELLAAETEFDSDDERELKQRVWQSERLLAQRDEAVQRQLSALADAVQKTTARLDTLKRALTGEMGQSELQSSLDEASRVLPQFADMRPPGGDAAADGPPNTSFGSAAAGSPPNASFGSGAAAAHADPNAAPPQTTKERMDGIFLQMYSMMETNFPRARDIFVQFDTDKSGTLNKAEFSECLAKMGIQTTQEEMVSVMKLIDRKGQDGQRTVSLEAFKRSITKWKTDRLFVQLFVLMEGDYTRARDLFIEFDEDQSGYLQRREFADVLNKLGVNVSEGEMNSVMALVDRDGEGTVSLSEFQRSIRKWRREHPEIVIPTSKLKDKEDEEADDKDPGVADVTIAVRALAANVCNWAQDMRLHPHKFGGPGGLVRRESTNMHHEEQVPEDEGGTIDVPLEAGPQTVNSKILDAAQEQLNDEDRYEEGLLPAAHAVGVNLTPVQIKEILHQFYRQPKQNPTGPMKKKREVRLQRRYIETLQREAEHISKLRRIIQNQKAELELARAQLRRRSEEDAALAASMPSNFHGTTGGGDWQASTDRFKKERLLVESMSTHRIKELEKEVRELEELYREEVEDNLDSQELSKKLAKDYVQLDKELKGIKVMWQEKEKEFQEVRAHNERLQQGRKEKDQIWRTRLLEVCRGVVDAMAQLPPVFARIRVCVSSGAEVNGDLFGELHDAVNSGLSSSLELVGRTVPYVPSEGYKVTLEEIQTMLQMEKSLQTDIDRKVENEPFDKRLFDQLQEKIEMLASENRSNFREKRYMKNVIKYVFDTADEVISGTYDYSKDKDQDADDGAPKMGTSSSGEKFPPPEVVRDDKDYAYAWIDERKLLQELLTCMKLYVRHGGAKPNSVNSLISVLGNWRDAMQAPVPGGGAAGGAGKAKGRGVGLAGAIGAAAGRRQSEPRE